MCVISSRALNILWEMEGRYCRSLFLNIQRTSTMVHINIKKSPTWSSADLLLPHRSDSQLSISKTQLQLPAAVSLKTSAEDRLELDCAPIAASQRKIGWWALVFICLKSRAALQARFIYLRQIHIAWGHSVHFCCSRGCLCINSHVSSFGLDFSQRLVFISLCLFSASFPIWELCRERPTLIVPAAPQSGWWERSPDCWPLQTIG